MFEKFAVMRETVGGNEFWVGYQNGLPEWDLDPWHAWKTSARTNAEECAERLLDGNVVTLFMSVET